MHSHGHATRYEEECCDVEKKSGNRRPGQIDDQRVGWGCRRRYSTHNPRQHGHVLVHKDGCIFGVKASIEDVVLADISSQGFAQLAYNLIKLGSHVIEQKLI